VYCCVCVCIFVTITKISLVLMLLELCSEGLNFCVMTSCITDSIYVDVTDIHCVIKICKCMQVYENIE